MKGKYGVSMGGIEHRPKRHYCRQCERCGQQNKKNKKQVFCKSLQKYVDRSIPHACKYFKQKWKDAKASECVTYHISDLPEEERARYE